MKVLLKSNTKIPHCMLPFAMILLWTLPITAGDFKVIIIYLLSLANFTYN